MADKGKNNIKDQEKRPSVYTRTVKDGPHSPYNFIRLNKKILNDPYEGCYNLITDEAMTGEIRYMVTAETPIYIDNGHGKSKKNHKDKDENTGDAQEQDDEEDKIPAGFFKNKDDKYAIPGSTMRGLIRTNMQILSFADVKDDIDDYNLMYRDVTGGAMQSQYNTVLGQNLMDKLSVLTEVKAGYIKREGGKYYLYPNIGDAKSYFSDGRPDYYVVSERDVIEGNKGLKTENFDYIRKNFHYIDGIDNGRFVKPKDSHNKELSYYVGKENKNYKPYWDIISYKVKDEKDGMVCGVDAPGVLKYKGCIISSGALAGKKVFYIIPERDKDERNAIEIPKEAVDAYKIDFNRRRNTIPDKIIDFYTLPDEGKIRPIFYIDSDMIYFGYTPRLRLMYKNTIHKGLSQEDGHDFVKTMFGYQNDDGSKRSRVFFTDAVLSGEGRELEERSMILAEPKPTSYLEYLMQRDKQPVSTYEDDNMHLLGIKQYWLHKEAQDPGDGGHPKAATTLKPLDAGSSFDGTVRFQNLTREELGLLIWSIRLEPELEMNIGMAKPYGYGRIKMENIELYLTDPKSDYTPSVDILSKNPLKPLPEDEVNLYVGVYKDFAIKNWNKDKNKVKDVMKIPSIKEFFTMKTIRPGEDLISYMTLDEYEEFKKSYNPLPNPLQIKDALEQDSKVNVKPRA